MIQPKYTESQMQALLAMAAAGWEAVNLVTQAAAIEAQQEAKEPEDGDDND